MCSGRWCFLFHIFTRIYCLLFRGYSTTHTELPFRLSLSTDTYTYENNSAHYCILGLVYQQKFMKWPSDKGRANTITKPHFYSALVGSGNLAHIKHSQSHFFVFVRCHIKSTASHCLNGMSQTTFGVNSLVLMNKDGYATAYTAYLTATVLVHISVIKAFSFQKCQHT